MAAKKRPSKKKATARGKAPKAKAKTRAARTRVKPTAKPRVKAKVKTGKVKRAKVKVKVKAKLKVAPPEPATPSLFEDATEAPLYDATGVFRINQELTQAQRDADEDERKLFRDPSLVVSVANGTRRGDDYDAGVLDDDSSDD